MFTAAFLTLLGLTFLAFKFGNSFVKRVIGMDAISDIVLSIGIVWIFGITATFSGMMTGIVMGVMVSMLLYFAKRLFPHQKLERVNGVWQWVDHSGEWFEKVKYRTGEKQHA